MPLSPFAVHEQHHRAGPSLREEASGSESVVRSVAGAQNTIAGYEAMNMIRKGQIRWLDKKTSSVRRPLWVAHSASQPNPEEQTHFTRAYNGVCDTARRITLAQILTIKLP